MECCGVLTAAAAEGGRRKRKRRKRQRTKQDEAEMGGGDAISKKVDWRRDCCLAKSNSTRVSSFEAPRSANSDNLVRSRTVFF